MVFASKKQLQKSTASAVRAAAAEVDIEQQVGAYKSSVGGGVRSHELSHGSEGSEARYESLASDGRERWFKENSGNASIPPVPVPPAIDTSTNINSDTSSFNILNEIEKKKIKKEKKKSLISCRSMIAMAALFLCWELLAGIKQTNTSTTTSNAYSSYASSSSPYNQSPHTAYSSNSNNYGYGQYQYQYNQPTTTAALNQNQNPYSQYSPSNNNNNNNVNVNSMMPPPVAINTAVSKHGGPFAALTSAFTFNKSNNDDVQKDEIASNAQSAEQFINAHSSPQALAYAAKKDQQQKESEQPIAETTDNTPEPTTPEEENQQQPLSMTELVAELTEQNRNQDAMQDNKVKRQKELTEKKKKKKNQQPQQQRKKKKRKTEN